MSTANAGLVALCGLSKAQQGRAHNSSISRSRGSAGARRRIIRIGEEDYVTAVEAAEILDWIGVTVHMIRDWTRRGLLTPAARLDGRPVYRLRDIRSAERTTRDRGRPRST